MKHELNNAAKWFEIPVRDLGAAQKFYEAVLGLPMRREEMGPHALAIFSYDEAGVGGCLMAGADVPPPSANGTLVYLNAEPSLDAALARATAAGAQVALGRTALPPGMGFFAHIVDLEGNRVGLHALS
jgi:predicted enzyme related to lactoylglutathione lyase